MSSPIRLERSQTPATPADSVARVTQELPLMSEELRSALRAERAGLRREVLLWQRWVRYLALGALVLLSLVFGTTVEAALIPMALVAVGYVAVVMVSAWWLGHAPARGEYTWIAWLLLAADAVTLSGFVYLTSPPAALHRILLLGFLSMQLAVFYFGRYSGSFAAGLTVAAYLVCALLIPPFVAGASVSGRAVAFNVTLYLIISVVLIYTFGSFRERMDALRAYCKIVERGEAASLPPLGAERWPDELTLLARSFQSMHERLAEQIGSDPLTGCMNRRALESRLRADLRQARRRGSPVAVIALDLDHFKEINDTRGHPIGDLVLQQVASIMKATARDTDSVARFGGDEFVVVLPDTGWQGALSFAERLRRRVTEAVLGPIGAPVTVTISAGVALGRGGDPTSGEILLKDADTALYKAKSGGRNQVFS